ncbi:MAG: FAD-dependent oxidoreductase, partial [Chloroflexi bacterium]|nr:FAD-dependent oxidoreductase [Chloroflexota bacterium]
TLDDQCEFVRKKSLYVASCTADVKDLHREFVLRKKYGIQLDWLDEQAIKSLFPFSRPAALLSYDAAQMDAYRFTHGVLQKAMRAGLRVFDRTEVLDFTHNQAGVCLSTTRNGHLQARKIVFATGYESLPYLKHKVAKLISTYALVSEPLDALTGWYEQCLIWESARPYTYLRTTNDGRIMIGGEDEDFRDPVRRDRLIPRKTKKLQQKFQQFFPQIPMEVAFSWAGTFGETKDGLAYIGATTDFPNAYFALGFGGNGITYSIIAGEIIRDAILGRTNPDGELFRFER